MTVQEAIKYAGTIYDITREPSDTCHFVDALIVLIRAAEENEGRKLAGKWRESACDGCPAVLAGNCKPENLLPWPCKCFADYKDVWVEAAKKEAP